MHKQIVRLIQTVAIETRDYKKQNKADPINNRNRRVEENTKKGGLNVFFKYLYHVPCTDGKISIEFKHWITFIFSFHRRPIHCCVHFCRPFVAITTSSAGLVRCRGFYCPPALVVDHWSSNRWYQWYQGQTREFQEGNWNVIDTTLEWKTVIWPKKIYQCAHFHRRRRRGRPQQSWKNQVTDFMRTRHMEEYMAEDRHLWDRKSVV